MDSKEIVKKSKKHSLSQRNKKHLRKVKKNLDYIEKQLSKVHIHRFLNSLLLLTVVYMLIIIDQENTEKISSLASKVKLLEQKSIIYDEELFVE